MLCVLSVYDPPLRSLPKAVALPPRYTICAPHYDTSITFGWMLAYPSFPPCTNSPSNFKLGQSKNLTIPTNWSCSSPRILPLVVQLATTTTTTTATVKCVVWCIVLYLTVSYPPPPPFCLCVLPSPSLPSQTLRGKLNSHGQGHTPHCV